MELVVCVLYVRGICKHSFLLQRNRSLYSMILSTLSAILIEAFDYVCQPLPMAGISCVGAMAATFLCLRVFVHCCVEGPD